MYYYGLGVQQSYSKAKELFMEGVKLKNLKCLNGLGLMYLRGHTEKQNYIRAYQLFKSNNIIFYYKVLQIKVIHQLNLI